MADYDFQNRELIECNTCGRSTWHRLVYSNSFDVNFYDGNEFFGELTEKWDLFQCMGCSNVTAKRTIGDGQYVTTDYLPDRTYAHHKKKHFLNIPRKPDKLYFEIIDTYNRKNYILCASGLRALLEGICLGKGITEGLNEQGKLSNSLEG